MTTAEYVRHVLAHYRDDGLPFSEAWVRALQSIPRGTNTDVVRQRREWVTALRWSRPAWEAAYRGEPLELHLPTAQARRLRDAAAAGEQLAA